MPSIALQTWQNDRQPRLMLVDLQCAASLAAVPPNSQLVDENLRGYAVLLSAHFQGFCRDLYAEGAQVVASKTRPSLQGLIQAQFTTKMKLNHGNPNVENIREDFERFGDPLDLAADPANVPRLAHLAALNRWRNIAAHHGIIPPGTVLNLPLLQAWRNSCDGLATALDDFLYNLLRRLLRRPPW
jgi:hypothetical protein